MAVTSLCFTALHSKPCVGGYVDQDAYHAVVVGLLFCLLSRVLFGMLFEVLVKVPLRVFFVMLELLFGGPIRVAGCIPCLQVVLNITNTFDSSFSRWTVGLGIEHQLNELRVAAGLEEEARFRTRARNLDYAQLVQPEVALPILSRSQKLIM